MELLLIEKKDFLWGGLLSLMGVTCICGAETSYRL